MKIIYQRKNDCLGFTLVETMVSLMIFSVAVMTISLVLQGIRRQAVDDYTTEFYLYLNILENHHYKISHCCSQQLILSKNHKKYNVSFSKQKIIMSTDKGGYVPILNHVKSVDWKNKNGTLMTNIEMINGRMFNGRSRL